MITLFEFLKRKPGMSKEAFREHYENSHVAIAKKYSGHLFLDYKRHYINVTGSGYPGGTMMDVMDATNYDAIGQVTLKDEAALAELNRIAQIPEVKAAFEDDEELFVDKPKLVFYICDEVKTWVAADLV